MGLCVSHAVDQSVTETASGMEKAGPLNIRIKLVWDVLLNKHYTSG